MWASDEKKTVKNNRTWCALWKKFWEKRKKNTNQRKCLIWVLSAPWNCNCFCRVRATWLILVASMYVFWNGIRLFSSFRFPLRSTMCLVRRSVCVCVLLRQMCRLRFFHSRQHVLFCPVLDPCSSCRHEVNTRRHALPSSNKDGYVWFVLSFLSLYFSTSSSSPLPL